MYDDDETDHAETATEPPPQVPGAADHGRQPGRPVPGLHRVLLLLDRAAVVRLGRLPGRLHHPAAHQGGALRRLRPADGAGRRRQPAAGLPVPADLPAVLARAGQPRPLPRGGHPDPHPAPGRRLDRDRRSSPAPPRRASGASTSSGATASTSAARTPTSSGTSASTSSTCRGCTTSSTSRWRSRVISLIAAAIVHYLYGGIRLQSQADRFSGAAAAQLSVLLGHLRAGQGRGLLARPLRPAQRVRVADHRRHLHRRQGGAAGAQHPDVHRVHLCGAVPGQHRAAHLAAALGRPRPAGAVLDPARPGLAGRSCSSSRSSPRRRTRSSRTSRRTSRPRERRTTSRTPWSRRTPARPR